MSVNERIKSLQLVERICTDEIESVVKNIKNISIYFYKIIPLRIYSLPYALGMRLRGTLCY